MATRDLLETYREGLTGLAVSRVWRGHGSALFVEFGELTPRTRQKGSTANLDGEFGLMIEWSWRIESAAKIVCGSWSEEELWKPAFQSLLGRTVEALSTFGRLPEITVALSGGLHVTSFMTSDGQPAWALFDRRAAEVRTLHCRHATVCEEA